MQETDENQKTDESQSSAYVHDGPERPADRPRDKKRQKDRSSGKKRLPQQKIAQLQMKNAKQFFPRLRLAEKDTAKICRTKLAGPFQKAGKLLQHAGFRAFSAENIFMVQPTKNKKGKESAGDEKAGSKNISKTGAGMEHAAGSMKRCRIAAGKSGSWAHGFAAVVMAAACALHNFRPESGPWQKADADDL